MTKRRMARPAIAGRGTPDGSGAEGRRGLIAGRGTPDVSGAEGRRAPIAREVEESSWRATWGVDRDPRKSSGALTGDTITDDQIREFRRLHPDDPAILDQLMRAIHGEDRELRAMARSGFADAINALEGAVKRP
jgi:hypothetical protein